MRDQKLLQRVAYGAASACYGAMFNWSYAHVESVNFDYGGAVFNPPTSLGLLACYIMAILPAMWMSPEADRPSSVALTVFYVLVYVPFVFVAPHVLPWPLQDVLLLEGFLLVCLALISGLVALPCRAFALIRVRESSYVLGLAVVTITLALLTAALNGFKVDLSIADVYTRRLAARETVEAGSASGYAVALLASTLLPLALIIGIARRRIVLVGASLLAVIAIFSLAGQKSIALTPLMLLGAYALIRWARRWFGAMVCLGMAALIAISDVAAIVYDNIVPAAVFSFRLLSGAGINMSRYFEFFSAHPYYLLRGSVLRTVLSSPYDRPMTMMMGAQYDPTEALNLNSNVWATAFGDGGYWAIILSSLIMGLLLWILDSLARGRHAIVFRVFGAFLGLIFAAMALPTAFITGGVVPSLAALYVLAGTLPDQVHSAHA